jgi:geranylgeranyl diphosphate synthase type I
MTPETSVSEAALAWIRTQVDAALGRFLAERKANLAALHPDATHIVDAIVGLVDAGGKRLRPAFCYWGHRAAGGRGDAIWRPAAALELLHTMALIHDDLIDGDAQRRGAATIHVREAGAAAAREQSDPERVGLGVAIVTGDLAAALAEELFLSADVEPDRLAAALERFHRMRLQLAAGAFLDLTAAGSAPAGTVAFLKGGAYTVEGPLLIGAALAGGSARVEEHLQAYARPLGEAFQLRDDLVDGDAGPEVTRERVLALVAAASSAIDGATSIGEDAADALRALAGMVAGS